ncbi:MAG: 30S ribosomal protein S17 [Mycoplasmataceae bacterium]|jgi:small subunit ribosomal protein S17|nr:30S ribosomal protein S17 [Mycoplasmataceae bacterium]
MKKENNIVRTTRKKVFVGIVVSTKMPKTAVVEVETKLLHPRYKKLVISHKKYHAHDEQGVANIGDKVRIVETRPISKTKFYRVEKVLLKAK